ncbi:UDP-glucuronate:xylan alpha-glucuronosyltransferase [Actinidia chinensis var. chinensis]|uniref:Hexosyltransferase n=1 Tax=Actinidia chinensis var. chinensis TaxID=1590841 RepID=A0A2R6RJS8_ACTCC|nr:UDP-glucuronate:xylan alpha-glucuronosyltransferase [Actinidia chinensis var. chinensis]
MYQRRFQRSTKEKDVEKPFHIPIHEKNIGKCKVHPLKLALVVLLCGNLWAFLCSPTACHHNHSSHVGPLPLSVNRWIWGGSDPRYLSHLAIDWDEISKVIQTVSDKNKVQEIGLLNFNKRENNHWKQLIPNVEQIVLNLDYVDKNVTWDSLYPEWIDEEQEEEVPICPSFPKIELPRKRLDLIAVKLPCRDGENWARDLARLHLQLAAAGLATASKGYHPVHLLFVTKCFPIPNLFTCKELVLREGNTWLYKPNLNVLREKLQLPVGSCELALPFEPKEHGYSGNMHREAYATILHSGDVYVCGAIAAAQSIRMAGSTRDLVILVDKTITGYHRSGLEAAGWKVQEIQRIRNPKAEKDSYNEWNYSKFRLWQLTDYDKIIFIDADMLVLRNIDFLFSMPEISATGNDATLFNSGVMVVEPSNCTYQLLMDQIHKIESYNGGDQGYLNEIFTWWHRIPKHMNFLKHFWDEKDEDERDVKTRLFGAEPPVLYVLHYLGLKPWLCFQDYDCNWNVDILQEFASDVAHEKWWKVHDSMSELLQQFCLLKTNQKAQLQWDRMQAEKGNYTDRHWMIKIRDRRLKRCTDNYCSWKNMLRHWGEGNTTDNKEFGVRQHLP